jgi:predicted cupin superfamily sugar epimerase
MADKEVENLIQKLGLEPHPEGGFFKETYRSEEMIMTAHGERHLSTAIYFLLTKNNFSAFHRIRSDETWHFHEGDPLVIHEIKPNGEYLAHRLGHIEKGAIPQLTIQSNSWFASELDEGGSYGLVSCTVSPGFDFRDFELADKTLLQEWPEYTALLDRLIR